jgi:uncharacterized protein
MRLLSAAAAATLLTLGLQTLTSTQERERSPLVATDDLVEVELSTVGLDGRAGTPIVLLREPESGSVVPIWVGSAEAQAIALALHGIEVPRPMTHDLMASLLAELEATVEEVLVHDLRDHTYLGAVRLRVNGEDRVREVDSRPSDALALALRTGAQIRVARRILVASPDFDFVAPEGPDQIVQLLGITVVAPTPDLRREFDLAARRGVVVTAVAGRAAELGLQRGDLITDVNGREVLEPMDFFMAVRAIPPGAQVRLTYVRAGETHRLELPADLPAGPARPGAGGLRI